MTKLGLIGGIGPEATVLYYRQICHDFQERSADGGLPQVVIESLSAFQVFAFFRAERFDLLTDYILGGVQSLAAAGADVAALTGNTPHVVLDAVRERSPIPLVSTIETTRDELLRRDGGRVALLGTSFTMTHPFFVTPLRDAGIDLVVPDQATVDLIQRRIENELERGIVRPETRAEFVEIAQRLVDEQGVSQVILG